MADLSSAIKQAEEALAFSERYCSAITGEEADGFRALRALLDAAREAESALATERRRREEAEGRLERIDAHAGQTCEAQGHSIDPCGPVEYEDAEGVPLCAECWGELCEEAALSAP